MSLTARLSEALNPIVIKELRQAVQSRFVSAVLLVLLAIQLAAIAIYLLMSREVSANFQAGQETFMILLGVLLAASLLFVPIYTAVRLLAERSDTNVDLLFITTIRPRSIIAGKLLAAAAITILIFSACMPFLTFTYFLRGVDLPSVFIVLVMSFTVIIVCSQIGVFIACLPGNRVFKVIYGLLALNTLWIAFGLTMAGATGLMRFGVGSALNSWDFWGPALAIALVVLGMGGALFVLSVALITPATANRALPVRLFLSSAWLVSGVTTTIWSRVEKTCEPVIAWMVLSVIIGCIALFAAISEREQLGRRVARKVPAGWWRMIVFPFFSGAASGVVWSCLMIGASLGFLWVWGEIFPGFKGQSDKREALIWMGGMSLYAYCYALTGAALRRYLLRRLPPGATWLVSVVLLALGSIVPFLIGYLLSFGEVWKTEEVGGWLIGNPFAWGIKESRELYFIFTCAWAAPVTAVNLPWLIEAIKNFRPFRESEPPSGIVELGLSE